MHTPVSRHCSLLIAVSTLVGLGSVPVRAEETIRIPDRWHLSAGLAGGKSSGGYGGFLKDPIALDLQIQRATTSGKWRLGGGLRFGSLDMETPYEEELEWAHFETFASATRVFRVGQPVRPYVQARLAIVRIHPRADIFNIDGWEDLPTGDSPTPSTNGLGLTLRPGFEVDIAKNLSLDVSAFWNSYRTSEFSLTPIEQPPTSSGSEYGVGFGFTWRPLGQSTDTAAFELQRDPVTGSTLPLPPASEERDAWGVRRSYGWAIGEMLAINFGASMFNEYVRRANFNQISPRSFWHNFNEGFTYDDNKFKTNQYIHPFNGNTYYNAARANGLDFWPSAAVAFTGAFVWECCGETHPISFNDQISTGIGGIAFGETAYRLSSLVLDNEKTGLGRAWRETAAFLINPIRGFNRIVTGDAWHVTGNPSADTGDKRPKYLSTAFMTGARSIGEGESISENTKTYGFAQFDVLYGSPFFNERRRPFDRFDAYVQFDFGEKSRIGRFQIRGDLFSTALGEKKKYAVALTQDFDYINNEAYEFGGQSFGPSFYTLFQPSANTTITTRLAAFGTILGGVNTNCVPDPKGGEEPICRSALADVANKERYREYDYGPGVGGGVEVVAGHKGRPFFTASYRYTWLTVSNGSIYVDEGAGGLAATHNVHRLNARLSVPLRKNLGLGVEGFLFLRKSNYEEDPELRENLENNNPALLPLLDDTDQRNPEVRAFLIWTFGDKVGRQR